MFFVCALCETGLLFVTGLRGFFRWPTGTDQQFVVGKAFHLPGKSFDLEKVLNLIAGLGKQLVELLHPFSS